ncbi:GFA family protein [Aspergillus melleus]|uniref:GFA family protein n=1 Tax=Aspergillus melleus TaxID=138277 RepID=UPI001E8E32E9|nr:uncharacterized protein LDX57_008429 [Aspergillus melleus]KAH8430766.1 hypothetical protein LDX57_008429 [Aspergillus melleus]
MTEIGDAGGQPFPNPMSDTTQEVHWKHRAPYQLRSAEDFGHVKWHGKCQCGQVRFKLNRDRPLKAKYCHCHNCQLLHGAPFQWAAIFHKTDIAFVNGAEGLAFYSSGDRTREYQTPTKLSCSYCHTPLMDEGRNMCMVFPTTIEHGSSDQEVEEWRKAFEIDCHIFYSARAVDVPDGKPKWTGLDGQSDQVD